MKYETFYVNGKWIEPNGKQKIEVINPTTEAPVGHVRAGTRADVDDAVSAAQAARDTWSRTTVAQRADCLRAIADGITSRGEELMEVITTELGMPTRICRGYQVDPPVMVIESYLELLQNFSFRRANKTSVSLLEPVGVCALITPWNYPLTQTMLKLAPALLAGCTVILKPSETTPLSCQILAEIIDAAGLPAGVFNLVQGVGTEVGAALADHPGVDLVSLTGSTRAGVSVATHAAQTLKRVTLELGGKSPHIVCDDADFSKVIPFNVRKCFSNSGQACDAPTRMLIPRTRYAEAMEIAKDTAESLRIGDPKDPDTELGPLVNRSQFNRVNELIKTGIGEGARVITGGAGRPTGIDTGFFVKPTVFADVDNSMKIAQQEIFGPVLCIIPCTDDEEAIRIANDTPYGLASYISTPDSGRAAGIAVRLRAGQVRINQAPFDITAPFGGYKMSGYGRELGTVGLEEYLQIKACMGMAPSGTK